MDDKSASTMNEEQAYRVLARKYRPHSFDHLIGQAPMVQTLTNAFKLGRIAQAYMLTGVRGVGKTTTARILARALNYETDGVNEPSIEMPEFGVHCQAIINSSHIDVHEMDAASHTGIDDIREIVEAVKYKPASARYKVYIIDEVHMLSKSAFNGLLKTLEEPPEHVKFIFATTEIRKVPVTVLSRCQRFDLRRIEAQEMVSFLKGVCEKEAVSVEEDALGLVARASEGSVRDALSLLDQAIAHGGGTVKSEEIRSMLGLADRARMIDLFEHLMAGRIKEALAEAKAQIDVGADPQVILADLLEFTHLVTTAKLTGGVPSTMALAELEKKKAEEFSANLSVRVLSRAWQILLKGVEEVQMAHKAALALDMVFVKLAYVADLPTPDEALKMVRQMKQGDAPAGSPSGMGLPSPQGVPVSQGANAVQMVESAPRQDDAVRPRPTLAASNPDPRPVEKPVTAPEKPAMRLNRFEDLVALAGEKRDLPMRSQLENFVQLIAFENGRIEFSLAERAPHNLVTDLKNRLQDWTGASWSVVLAREGGAEPLRFQREAEERQQTKDAEEDPVVSAVLKQFPGSKIVNVTFHKNDDHDDMIDEMEDWSDNEKEED